MQGDIQRRCKSVHILGHLLKGHHPFVVRHAFLRRDLRRHVKLGHDPTVGSHGLLCGALHLFGNHMLSKGRREMLDASRHKHPRGGEGHKFDRVANVIAPQPSVAAQHHGILHPQFHLAHRQARGRLVEVAVRGNEFKEDAVVHIQQHPLHPGCILVRQETF